MKVKEMKRILSQIDEEAEVYVLAANVSVCTMLSVSLEFPANEDGSSCVNILIAEEIKQ